MSVEARPPITLAIRLIKNNRNPITGANVSVRVILVADQSELLASTVVPESGTELGLYQFQWSTFLLSLRGTIEAQYTVDNQQFFEFLEIISARIGPPMCKVFR